MNFKRIVAWILVGCMLSVALVSCKKGDGGDEPPVFSLGEAPTPIADDQQTDYTQNSEQAALIEALRATFSDMAETAAEQFEYLEQDGRISILHYRGNAENVRIPAEIEGKPVTAIQNGAFVENRTLQVLYIPDSIETVGTNVLTDCTALTALRAPLLGTSAEGTQYLGYLFGATKHEDNAMKVPASLKYLELGGGMTSLPAYALYDCNDLLCVTLPKTLTKLERFSLYRCERLLAINVAHLQVLEESALRECRALTYLAFGEALTSIGLGALEDCSALRRLQLPFVGGTKTENTYLAYIFGASKVDFSKGYYPDKLVTVELLPTCTALPENAFFECESLTRIALPETLTSIGLRAFYKCERLFEIPFPKGLTSIGDYAFYRCRSLEKLELAETSLTTLGIHAFANCDAVKTVTLPTTLKALPASCFANDLDLETVSLGGVEQVGKNAFHNCGSIDSVEASVTVKWESGNSAAKNAISNNP